MTIRRSAPVRNPADARAAVLAARCAAAFDAARDAEAARVVRVVRADGAVVVATAETPPPPPPEAEIIAERIRALRARMGGSARPVGR
jgi:hypothetical protein